MYPLLRVLAPPPLAAQPLDLSFISSRLAVSGSVLSPSTASFESVLISRTDSATFATPSRRVSSGRVLARARLTSAGCGTPASADGNRSTAARTRRRCQSSHLGCRVPMMWPVYWQERTCLELAGAWRHSRNGESSSPLRDLYSCTHLVTFTFIIHHHQFNKQIDKMQMETCLYLIADELKTELGAIYIYW